MTDTYYLQNRIQLETNNLQRGHVYYSIDEQPEVCARLVAEAIGIPEPFGQKAKKMAEQYMRDSESTIHQYANMTKEEYWGHRVSVTVQSWDDVPAAIGLIRQRQQDFKKRNNL